LSAVGLPGRAPAETRIRVLLLESDAAVRAGADAGPLTRVEPAGEGLRADGRSVGAVWRLEEGGVLRAGDLRVRGSLEVRRTPEGLRVVNHVPLEQYVAGTLGREIYDSWNPETLKAQAVVIRTYALHEQGRRSGRSFDLERGTRGQVYGGADAETPRTLAATAATRGEYLAWQGRPILAVYHSSSGGRTASSEEVWGRALPYLVSLAVDHEEDSPDTYWRAAFSRTTLGRALTPAGIQVGSVRELQVVERSPSGRALRVRVEGEDGEAEIEARALRRALGNEVIRSTLFETRLLDDGVVFVGSGHGHGVGMSQWGAEAMASRGAAYREILATFYPGSRLEGGKAR
jgi:stage II sporulation protein D